MNGSWGYLCKEKLRQLQSSIYLVRPALLQQESLIELNSTGHLSGQSTLEVLDVSRYVGFPLKDSLIKRGPPELHGILGYDEYHREHSLFESFSCKNDIPMYLHVTILYTC